MSVKDNKKRIAFLFGGQGTQYVGMGKDVFDCGKEGKRIFGMGENLKPGISELCFNGPAEELIKTKNAQPCLYLTELSYAFELKNRGIEPVAAAGFSFGEIPALAFGGAVEPEDGFLLAVERGKEMEIVSEEMPGEMVAVLNLGEEKTKEICAEIGDYYAVNFNCPGQITCSGKAEKTIEFINKIKGNGGRAVKLATSGAFHTPYMKAAGEKLAKFLENVKIRKTEIPVYGNSTAMKYPDEVKGIKENIIRQLSSSVMFEKTLRNMANDGIDTFIEIGAGKTLTGFVKKTLPYAGAFTVSDMESLEKTAEILKSGI